MSLNEEPLDSSTLEQFALGLLSDARHCEIEKRLERCADDPALQKHLAATDALVEMLRGLKDRAEPTDPPAIQQLIESLQRLRSREVGQDTDDWPGPPPLADLPYSF